MNRRDALKTTGALLGGALLGGPLAGCGRESRDTTPEAGPEAAPNASRGSSLSAADRALAEEIADTLLPTTAASPGAKAAGAGAAMDLLLTDCYPVEARQRAVSGLAAFRATCQARGGEFASLTPAVREELLLAADAEARKAGEAHWFGLVRELAHRAYFSSEVGMTQALRYVRVPGRWVGCVPLAPGQPAWG